MFQRTLSAVAGLLLLGVPLVGGCGDDPALFGDGSSDGGAPGDAAGGSGAGTGTGGEGAGAGGGGGAPLTCGDALCDPGEDCTTCTTDCGDCPCEGPDCEGPSCGDGVCDPSEGCESCALDCGACQPACGDLVCDGGETCASCPGDCGTCNPVCGDGVCEPNEVCQADCGCSQHTQCGGDQICYGGSCESAYGRNYVFTVVSASFPTNNPNDNQPWDPIGPPDPFVDLCTAQACPAQTTTTKADTYSPVWNEPFLVTFNGPSTGSFTFQMWDEDFALHDFALQTPIGVPSDWVQIVRTQNGSYAYNPSAGLQLTITIQPQ